MNENSWSAFWVFFGTVVVLIKNGMQIFKKYPLIHSSPFFRYNNNNANWETRASETAVTVSLP